MYDKIKNNNSYYLIGLSQNIHARMSIFVCTLLCKKSLGSILPIILALLAVFLILPPILCFCSDYSLSVY